MAKIFADDSFRSVEDVEHINGWTYNISKDMLEPIIEELLYVATDNELKELMA